MIMVVIDKSTYHQRVWCYWADWNHTSLLLSYVKYVTNEALNIFKNGNSYDDYYLS